jgi:hypothetical protein
MKCEVLLINRGRAKLYKKAKFETSTITVKTAFLGLISTGDKTFYIPDGSKFLDNEKLIGTKALWVVDEVTSKALSWVFEEDKKDILKSVLRISDKSDPTTKFKLNVLSKTSFWEMLAKKLKMGLMLTFIYLAAGAGIGLFLLYLIKVIFLKESSI